MVMQGICVFRPRCTHRRDKNTALRLRSVTWEVESRGGTTCRGTPRFVLKKCFMSTPLTYSVVAI